MLGSDVVNFISGVLCDSIVVRSDDLRAPGETGAR